MNKYIPLVQKYLDANKSLDKVYTFDYEGKIFIGMNTVFSPFVFEDTYFFAKHLPSQPNSEFLEIGCGTGLISSLKALDGLNVTATDINKDAIYNTRINAILHSVENKVSVLYSDVFESIIVNHIFDIIFWNPPFIFTPFSPNTFLEKSVFDLSYSSITKFLNHFADYLSPKGRAFLGFSSTSGDLKHLSNICNERKITLNLFAKSFLEGNAFEEPFSLELYELCLS